MKLDKKNIAILGSTGSIGIQALEVVSGLNKYFNVCVITTNNNADLVIKQAIKFLPDYVVINNPKKYNYVKK